MPELIPDFDLYSELEVSETASPETIEAAWRSLMKRHHPDLGAASSADRSIRLNVAHDWLTDPARRARYDADRAAARRKREALSSAPAPRRPETGPGPRNERPRPAARPPGHPTPRMARPCRRRRDWRRAGIVVVAVVTLVAVGVVRMLVGGTGEAPSDAAAASTPVVGPTARVDTPTPPTVQPTVPPTEVASPASPRPAPTPRATVGPPSRVPTASGSRSGPTFSGSGNRNDISMTLAAGTYAVAYVVSAPAGNGCGWVLWLTDADGFESLAASAYPLPGGTIRDTETEIGVPAGAAAARVETDCPRWSFTMTRTGP